MTWRTSGRETNGSTARSQTARPSRSAKIFRFVGSPNRVDRPAAGMRTANFDMAVALIGVLHGSPATWDNSILTQGVGRGKRGAGEITAPADATDADGSNRHGIVDGLLIRNETVMEHQPSPQCPGPHCATAMLEWLRRQAMGMVSEAAMERGVEVQGRLFTSAHYSEEAPALRSDAELAGAVEHLEYSVFRRRRNQLTRAERSRLDNTIDNALFKIDRYLGRMAEEAQAVWRARVEPLRVELRQGLELAEHRRQQARRAEARLAQLDHLTPEDFEEFAAELFEAMEFQVERSGGTGDEGIDLRIERRGLVAIVQCKYYRRGVIGSPELQRFLGSIRHAHAHKGYFVTTRTFSLAAEKFAAEHPIELVDGPRLVELVHEALGPGRRTSEEPQPWLAFEDEDFPPPSAPRKRARPR